MPPLRAAAVLACAALAAGAAGVAFTADVSAPPAPLSPRLWGSFGSSHASTTLRAKYRAHLEAVRSTVPFQRVRFHGILDDDMSTFLTTADGSTANGALVFDTLDYLVGLGVRPTVELGFMPAGLAANASETTFHYQGGISTFADAAAWSRFVSDFVRMIVARYGVDLVSTWRFEVWNEPNCGFFYVGHCCGPTCGNQTAYFRLYDVTARAVKAVDARLLVGGPATAQLGWLPEMVAAAAAAGSPLDFLSSHLYPTDPQLPATRDAFSDAVAAAAGVAAGAGLPFLLT
jgi:xylan 1,4-beta-xylosidase